MEQSYAAIGGIFEYLNSDCGYEQWSQYLIKTLQDLGAGPAGVDVGCGNGRFTRELIRHGKDVLGVDVSPQMLSAAAELARKEGVRAEFLLGDITKLKLNGRRDFAVAINDCLNYVPRQKLHAAFSHVAGCLKKGGTFVFDVSTPYKLKEVLGDNTFCEDADDFAYIWFNRWLGDGTEMELTLFTRTQGGLFARSEERHVQYAHETEDVISALEGAGFRVLRTEGHLGTPLTPQSQRVNFICRRV